MTPPGRQRGVALLVAILLVAIGTIIAASIAFQSAMAARRGIASFSFEQSVLVAQGAEALAAYALREDDGGDSDSYADAWAQPLPPTEISPGVVLEARVEDMQGRFNLNSLVDRSGAVDKVSLEAFRRLLKALEINTKYADQMADWIDPDSNTNGFDGLEDNGTTSQQPPYRVANTIITSTSDLLALPGFKREDYVKLEPYVAALPPGAKLNTCTAPGLLLDAMVEEGYHYYGQDPEDLANRRKKVCYPKADEFVQVIRSDTRPDATQLAAIQSHFLQTSSYFRLTSLITLGGSDFALYSLLHRQGSAGQGKVRVIRRGFTPD